MYESRTRTVAKTIMCFVGQRIRRTLRSVRPTRWLGNEPLEYLGCRAALVTGKPRQRAYECARAPRLPERRQLVPPFRLLESRDQR